MRGEYLMHSFGVCPKDENASHLSQILEASPHPKYSLSAKACLGINDYTLRVSLPVSVDYLHILDDMRRYVAANVLIDPLILLSKIKIPHYTGSAFRHSIKQTLTTEEWDMENINLLADENSKVLMEEAENKVFYEEVNTNGT